jgi:hypothetical protein
MMRKKSYYCGFFRAFRVNALATMTYADYLNTDNFEGHNAYKYKYGGHPAPAGRALPNLLMQSEC